MPIVSTNLFAVPEIVKDKENGFIVKIPGYDVEKGIAEYHIQKMSQKEEEKFVSDIIKQLEKLIKNKKLREKMGEESFKIVNEGEFSIKKRNEKLRKIYEEALK